MRIDAMGPCTSSERVPHFEIDTNVISQENYYAGADTDKEQPEHSKI